MYVCRLLTRIKRTCYTIEIKSPKMQMSKKKKNTIAYTQKTMQVGDETN